METEAHVCVAHCIARAIARDEYCDLGMESSNWSHPVVGTVYQELVSSGFTRSNTCSIDFHSWMSKLSNGSPLFGDDLRTAWSFYTYFSNQELTAMIPVFRAAVDHKRAVPEGFPEEVTSKMVTSLSEGGKEFLRDLINWFGQIQDAGQDAFILWW